MTLPAAKRLKKHAEETHNTYDNVCIIMRDTGQGEEVAFGRGPSAHPPSSRRTDRRWMFASARVSRCAYTSRIV